MSFAAKQATAMLMLGAAFAPAAVGAHTGPESDAGQRAVTMAPAGGTLRLTGKERVGEKWQDEQRIDNCKVPLDKRGIRRGPTAARTDDSKACR